MLEEQQVTRGLEHAGDLRQGGTWVGDRAEHERRHHRVEARVGEGQTLAACVDDLGGPAEPSELLLQLAPHLAVRLRQHELGHRVGIELDVDPGAGADLKRAPLRAGQQRAPLVAQARVLGDLVEAIVATGEQRSPE